MNKPIDNRQIADIAKLSDAPKKRPHLLALEPRIVLDAAAVVTAVEATADAGDTAAPADDAAQATSLETFAEAMAVSDERNEIAFISTSVANYAEIIAQIDPAIEVVILDDGENGVEQMAKILQARENLDAIHLITHGDDGQINLGNATLNLDSINGEYSDELSIIGAALSSNADFLIYGCDFGSGAEGQLAAEALAAATGADIAASNDVTGHASLGGDWDLEVTVGVNETTAIVAADWQGTLAAFTDDGGNNDVPSDDHDITAIDVDYTGLLGGTITGFVQMDPSGGSNVFMSMVIDVDGDGNANYDYFVELDGTDPHTVADFNLYYGVKDTNTAKLSGNTSVVPFDAVAPSTISLSQEDNPFEGASNQDSRISFTLNLSEIVVDWNTRFPSDPIVFSDIKVLNATTHTSASPTSQIKDEQFDSSLSSTPLPADDTATTTTNTDVDIDVIGNDHRLSPAEVSIVTGSEPANGTATANSDGTITYTPGTGFIGIDTFSYETVGTDGNTYTAEVTVTVIAGSPPIVDLNSAIAATGDGDYDFNSTFVAGDSALSVADADADVADFDGNITDLTITTGGVVDGKKEVFTIAGETFSATKNKTVTNVSLAGSSVTFDIGYVAATGTFSITNTAGTANPIPAADLALLVQSIQYQNNTATLTEGNRTLTFVATDSTGISSTSAVATIAALLTPPNAAPVAADDTANVNEDAVDAALSPTAPSDADGDTLTISITQVPTGAQGTAEYSEDVTGNIVALAAGDTLSEAEFATLTFTPVTDYDGTVESITYSVSDGTASASGSIAISITAQNDAPVAATDSVTVNEDATRVALSPTVPTDVDGDALTINVTAVPTAAQGAVEYTEDGTGNIITLAASSSLSEAEFASLTFTPAANYDGSVDTITYTVDDGTPTAVAGSIALAITGANDAPVAATDSVTVNEDAVDVALNPTAPTDVDGDALTINVTAVPTAAQGAVEYTEDGTGNFVTLAVGDALSEAEFVTLTFTPVADYDGSVDTITYTVDDGTPTAVAGSIALAITGANDAPVAATDSVTVNEDATSVALSPTAPTDVDGDTLTINVTAVPTAAQGAVEYTEDGTGNIVTLAVGDALSEAEFATLTFTPAADYDGAVDTITYTVDDGTPTAVAGSIALAITGANDAPVAATDSVTVNEDATRVALSPTAPSDADGDTLTINMTAVPTPAQGAVEYTEDGTGNIITLAAGDALSEAEFATLTFTPAADYDGAVDTITYTVDDGTPTAVAGSIALAITGANDAPVAATDSVTVNEDAVDVALNPTAPTDVDGDALTINVTAVPTPAQGAVEYTEDGTGNIVTLAAGDALSQDEFASLTFTPVADYDGSVDTITYTVDDGTPTAVAGSIALAITGANDAPVAATDSVTVNEDATRVALSPTAPTDVDGDTLTINVTAVPTAAQGAVEYTEDGTGNIITLAAGDALSEAEFATLTFTPVADYDGSVDTITYTVDDGTPTAVAGSIALAITGANDAPTSAGNTVTTNEDTDHVFAVTDFAFADADTGNSLESVRIDTLPSDGKLYYKGAEATGVITVTAAELANGDLVFTPDADENGTTYATFSYSVNDGDAFAAASATMTLDVTAQNDAPVVSAAVTGGSSEDAAAFSVDLLTNASDVDSASLNVTGLTLVSGDAAGVTINTNSLDIDPSAYGALNAGQQEVITYSYSVSDGAGGTVAQTATITITGANDAPTSAGNTVTTNEDTDHVFAVTDFAFADADTGDALESVRINTLPSDGKLYYKGAEVTGVITVTAAELAAGDLVFTPDADENGTTYATFSYSVNDGDAFAAAFATMTLDVTAHNDVPVASTTDSVTVNEDATRVALSPTAPSDVDGDTLTINVTAVPTAAQGAVEYTEDGTGNIIALAAGDALSEAEFATLTFTPAANYDGSVDTITYTVDDGTPTAVAGSIALAITGANDTPVAATDSVTVNEDATRVALSPTAPTDVDGDTLTINVTAVPTAAQGAVEYTEDGTGNIVTLAAGDALSEAEFASLTFTPVANYDGAVNTITYTVDDGTPTAVAGSIALAITGANDAPVAATDSVTVNEDATSVALNPTAPSDADGDTLTINVTAVPTAAQGEVEYTEDGTGNIITLAAGDALSKAEFATLTFTPAADYDGAVNTITYTVDDGTPTAVAGSIALAITGANDAPVAATDSVTVNEDATSVALNPTAPSDADGDTLTINVTAVPTAAQGAVEYTEDGTGNIITLAAGDALSEAEFATLTFTPVADYDGAVDTITYSVDDGTPSAVAGSIALAITGANDAPTVTGPVSDNPTEDDAGYSIDLLAGATDIDGDTLKVSRVKLMSGDASGITIDGNSLDVDPSAYNSLAAGQSEVITYSYWVFDGNGGKVAQTVAITITGVNDAPVVTSGTATVIQGETNVALNPPAPTDVDGDMLLATITQVPSAEQGTVSYIDDITGNLVVASGGNILSATEFASLTFMPAANYAGPVDPIGYSVTDGTASGTGALSLTIIEDAAAGDISERSNGTADPTIIAQTTKNVPVGSDAIEADGAIVETVRGLGDLGSTIDLMTADGIIVATADALDGLGGMKSIGGASGYTASELTADASWSLSQRFAQYANADLATWDAEPIVGFALRMDANISGHDNQSGQLDQIVVESLMRDDVVYLQVSNTLVAEPGKRVTDYRFLLIDGRPLQDWIQRVENDLLVIKSPLDVEGLELKIISVLENGETIIKDVKVDLRTGQIVPVENAESSTLAPQLFSDEIYEEANKDDEMLLAWSAS